MIRNLLDWLSSIGRKPRADDLHDQRLQAAKARRKAAAQAFLDAQERHDTRDQHKALLAFRRATHAQLAAELGR